MTLIEGVGNEVVHFAAVLLLAAVAAIAWWSTNSRPYHRYRVTLAMRHTAPQPVSLRIRPGAPPTSMIYINRQSAASRLQSTGAGSRALESNPVTEDVVPLQEMDSMVDADMALLDHNRLRFYRRVDSPRLTQSSSEALSEEGESESEPAGRAQMREMDSIVSAMEADDTAGRTVFNTTADNDSNSTAPMIAEVRTAKKDRKDSNTATESSAQQGNDTNTSNDEMQVNDRKILIKLKYLNDTLKEVEGSLDELLKDFKWRHFSRELSTDRRVRLIYNGRVLIDEGATLSALGLRHRSVVHCLVHPQSGRTEEAASAAGPVAEARAERGERHWDLENILMTLVSVALTVVWFFRCEYSNMFTASASVALFGLTLFYSVAIFGLYFSDSFHSDRRPPQPVPNN